MQCLIYRFVPAPSAPPSYIAHRMLRIRYGHGIIRVYGIN